MRLDNNAKFCRAPRIALSKPEERKNAKEFGAGARTGRFVRPRHVRPMKSFPSFGNARGDGQARVQGAHLHVRFMPVPSTSSASGMVMNSKFSTQDENGKIACHGPRWSKTFHGELSTKLSASENTKVSK